MSQSLLSFLNTEPAKPNSPSVLDVQTSEHDPEQASFQEELQSRHQTPAARNRPEKSERPQPTEQSDSPESQHIPQEVEGRSKPEDSESTHETQSGPEATSEAVESTDVSNSVLDGDQLETLPPEVIDELVELEPVSDPLNVEQVNEVAVVDNDEGLESSTTPIGETEESAVPMPASLRKHIKTTELSTPQTAPSAEQPVTDDTPVVPASLRQALSAQTATTQSSTPETNQAVEQVLPVPSVNTQVETSTQAESLEQQVTIEAEAAVSLPEETSGEAQQESTPEFTAETAVEFEAEGEEGAESTATQNSANRVSESATQSTLSSTQNVVGSPTQNRQSEASANTEPLPTIPQSEGQSSASQSVGNPFSASPTQGIAADQTSDSVTTEAEPAAETKPVQTPTEVFQTSGTSQASGTQEASAARPVATLDVRDPQFGQKLTELLEQASSRSQMLRVRLTPQELGQVDVSVQLKEGVLIARLEADTFRAQQILQEHVASLKESLANQGLAVDRIEVVDSETEFSDFRGRDFEQGEQQSSEDNSSETIYSSFGEQEEETAPAAVEAAGRQRISMSEIDIEV